MLLKNSEHPRSQFFFFRKLSKIGLTPLTTCFWEKILARVRYLSFELKQNLHKKKKILPSVFESGLKKYWRYDWQWIYALSRSTDTWILTTPQITVRMFFFEIFTSHLNRYTIIRASVSAERFQDNSKSVLTIFLTRFSRDDKTSRTVSYCETFFKPFSTAPFWFPTKDRGGLFHAVAARSDDRAHPGSLGIVMCGILRNTRLNILPDSIKRSRDRQWWLVFLFACVCETNKRLALHHNTII